jgi:hypothetical protein
VPTHRHLEIKPASQLVRRGDPKADAALLKARAWMASPSGQAELGGLAPTEAAELALRKLYQELTGVEPQGAEPGDV